MSVVRSTAFAVAGGLAAALLSVSAASGKIGGLMLAGMAPLPLFLVGLSFGIVPAAIASMVGAVVILAADPGYGTAFVGYFAVPVMILVSLALRRRRNETAWPPAGRLVLGLTALAVVAFLALDLSLMDQPGGLEGYLRTAVDALVKQLPQSDPQAVQAEPMLQALVSLATGIGLAWWIGLIVVNGVLAQGALAGFGWARRPAPVLAEITIPLWGLVLLAAAVMAASLGRGEIAFAGSNLSIILAVPFLFQGLGVIHALTARSSKQAWLLAGVYGLVLIFGWLIIPLIVALGVIEQWVGLRRRYAATGQEKSDG